MVQGKFDSKRLKIALARVIAPHAYWSFHVVDPSKVSDDKLIEAVLVHGNDALKKRLLGIFSTSKVRSIWEQKLVIQDARLHDLNRKIASELLHISNPESHIREAYKKYNLYDRFSA